MGLTFDDGIPNLQVRCSMRAHTWTQMRGANAQDSKRCRKSGLENARVRGVECERAMPARMPAVHASQPQQMAACSDLGTAGHAGEVLQRRCHLPAPRQVLQAL